jgi:hypothetical protein
LVPTEEDDDDDDDDVDIDEIEGSEKEGSEEEEGEEDCRVDLVKSMRETSGTKDTGMWSCNLE